MNALTFAGVRRAARARARRSAPTTRSARLIITGAGRGFCAGLDLDDAARLTGDERAGDVRRPGAVGGAIAALRRMPTPVIAAVNGAAAGAGFGLALAADIRIAAPQARFNAAFVRIGLSGGDVGVSWMLPRIVGFGHAAELLLTGRLIGADDAFRLGIVNRIVPAEELLDVGGRAGARDRGQQPVRDPPDQGDPADQRRRAVAGGRDRAREPQPGAGGADAGHGGGPVGLPREAAARISESLRREMSYEPIEFDEQDAQRVEEARGRPTRYWVGVTLVLVLLTEQSTLAIDPDGADTAQRSPSCSRTAGESGSSPPSRSWAVSPRR